jgi:hypothetical protein
MRYQGPGAITFPGMYMAYTTLSPKMRALAEWPALFRAASLRLQLETTAVVAYPGRGCGKPEVLVAQRGDLVARALEPLQPVGFL